MLKKLVFVISLLFIIGLIGGGGSQAEGQTSSRVRFARGASSATVKSRISGYKYVDYVIGVRRGQILSFVLTRSGSAEAVLFTETEQNVPGGDGVLDYSGKAGYTGDYKIRVLMPRSFARRNASSVYTLKISVE
jgi:hypothetical protein